MKKRQSRTPAPGYLYIRKDMDISTWLSELIIIVNSSTCIKYYLNRNQCIIHVTNYSGVGKNAYNLILPERYSEILPQTNLI